MWICKPGLAKNWCVVNLTTTAVLANGTRHVSRPAVSSQPIDCFYVYPSISTERRPNSDLVVHTGEAYTAVTQAAQFAPDCAVYAPMYHQVTSYAGKDGIAPGNFSLEYTDVLAAWRDYLAHDNHGHGVVLTGHSGLTPRTALPASPHAARRRRPGASSRSHPGAARRRPYEHRS